MKRDLKSLLLEAEWTDEPGPPAVLPRIDTEGPDPASIRGPLRSPRQVTSARTMQEAPEG